jgi:hypothetical protein
VSAFFVGVKGDRVVVLNPPQHPMTAADAVLFGAQLMVMAECVDPDLDLMAILVKERNS